MEIPTPLPPPPQSTITVAGAVAGDISGTTASAVKTPDPDSEPPQSNAVTKQLPPPLTNGVLKRHKPLHHHHQPPPVTVAVAYKECLKNHAAAMGGHAIDGCGEFMPSPTSSPTYPTTLKCAACGCHRNFHRREPEESLFPSPPTHLPIQHVIEYQPHHRHHPPPPPSHQPPPAAAGSPGNSPSPPPISSSYYPSAPHMLLALSTGGVSAPPDHININNNNNNNNNNHNLNHNSNNISTVPTTPGSSGKKRFRTKFTQDQKEKMHEIAERVGWKMQKRDEDMIIAFCNQIGVDKNVFKVWMHNNKITLGTKKDFTNNNSSGDGIDFIISRNNLHQDDDHHNHNNQHHLRNDSFSAGGNVICPKGSSSSS